MKTHITEILPDEAELIISLKRKAIAILTEDTIQEGDLLKIVSFPKRIILKQSIEITCVISDVQEYASDNAGNLKLVSFHIADLKNVNQ